MCGEGRSGKKHVTVGSALAGLSNNGNPSSLIMGIIIVIDQSCNNGRNIWNYFRGPLHVLTHAHLVNRYKLYR